jgi:hypothetical protein
MTHFFPVVLCLAGFSALALATDRQQDDLFGKSLAPAATRALRVAGSLLLLLSLAVLVRWQGWGMGLVQFSGHTSACAGVVYCALIVMLRRQAG